MKIKLTPDEALAMLELRAFIRGCVTPPDQFLHWIADRLIHKNNDEPQVDFVQKLREYASLFSRLSRTLS